MTRPAADADTILLTASHSVWDSSYEWAAVLGCNYPGEPAGQSVRLLLSAGPSVAPSAVRDSIRATVWECDACFGHCPVRISDDKIDGGAGQGSLRPVV